MPIRILSPEVAAKIAAGEVVERPASAVKELIENSLDAGATRITIEVEGGGVRLIRVSDNGSGLEPEEALLAFQRHATSKVASAEDLDAISTLGFRGEALPSIAAVADVAMLTRPASRLAGAFIHLKGGQVIESGPRGCPAGTSVAVRGLFAQVPARLKFLKSEATEAGHIQHLVTMFALAFPEVRFALALDGRSAFQSPGSGKLEDALVPAFGREVAGAMLRVEVLGAAPEVWGFVSPPSVTRAGRGGLCLFVNRRYIQSRMLSYAVEEAYSGLLMAGRHPLAVLHLSLPYREVDVNVHPAKAEVKFRDERSVFAGVQRAVRSALVGMAPVPSMRPQAPPSAALTPAPLPSLHVAASTSPSPSPSSPSAATPILRVLGQLSATYIIAEGQDGLFLIDQHTAHERVLFERLRREPAQVQGLLEPAALDLNPRQAEMAAQHGGILGEHGFIFEPFGERAYILRGVPALLKGEPPAQAFLAILDSLAETGKAEDWRRELTVSLACHSAVRAGQTLTMDEMRELVRELEATALPRTCPHGRPIFLHLSSAQLEREFGRR